MMSVPDGDWRCIRPARVRCRLCRMTAINVLSGLRVRCRLLRRMATNVLSGLRGRRCRL
ncbi:hypothetical protein KCP76_01820 [Salmonella enterica subsp. enterica serovar Weltevreden]|nr:hypothetical protein KCP76_01820 [Salmonella enterica subsp. enterica serovar Weltevreden]